MPTQTVCVHCDPPGSGRCVQCQGTGKRGRMGCPECQGSGFCGKCYGVGFEPTERERTVGTLLGVWWISWFGIIGGFLLVGVWEYRSISSQGGALPRFSLTLLIVTSLLWAVFYAVDGKARAAVEGAKNEQVVVHLLTMAGTFLAIITLLEILFFIYIAPRVQ